MNKIRWQKVKSSAKGMLSRYAPTLPVDVRKIAHDQGLTIVEHEFADELICGFLDRERRLIGLNRSHHESRKRFTIAHELGHLALHRSSHEVNRVLFRDQVSSSGTNVQEIEANWFAAEVLMPEQLVRDQVAKYPFFSDFHIDELAASKCFNVSSQAMTIRLTKLSLLNHWD